MEDSEKADSEPIPSSDEASSSQGKSCALCGSATPAVRCDRCNSQIFCLSCDDMYHRHPKRKLHLRKAVESIWSSARSPRFRRRTDLPGDPCKIPIPPPRTKKRERHTIGGRMFLKSGLELGSFGHSKQHLPTSKDFFPGQKSPASLVESNCDEETLNQNMRNEAGQIYENDNANPDDRSPWNTRPNISSPIQVSIPSNSPDIVTNGQSFGYPTKPHSQSAADLTGHAGHPIGHHPYHFHPPYPYMHPSMHPSMHPYSHSMAHLNCAQCISSSWSNLMSPHPSPYFHPMPWGSAQNSMSRGAHIPGHPAPMKHSHGDLVSYPDSNFHYPYPGGGYYPNGPPAVDPNFIKDLHEQAEMQRQKKETTGSQPSATYEEMDTNPGPVENEPSSSSDVVPPTEANASADQDVEEMEKLPEVPTEPWSCVHCTFINPPGSYICQVCCKTSYRIKQLKSEEEESEMRPMSRDSESPLVNRDALLNSPEMSGFKEAQKDASLQIETQVSESELRDQNISRASNISEGSIKLTTETQTSTTTKTTDAQTQNILLKSIASSTDSIFPKQDLSVQTETEKAPQNCSVATDPMISSQSMESLLSGVSAPPYHNRRAGWGRGASFSTQSLYERGRSRSPMPRSLSSTMYNEGQNLGRNSNFASEEAMHSISQAWLYTDPMYYKPHNQDAGHPLTKEDYFDGTWGSMDRLNHRVKSKKDKGKLEHMRPKFHRSLDDLKSEKRPEIVHTQELMMLQTVKEAERCGFTLEDLHVAYLNCGKENPVYWLEDNWSSMIKNVIALAAKYGEDNEENDVGVISTTEAKDALRIHRGDIWDAVTECIENRQRKILELTVRGNFTQKQIADALKHNEGNVELAYADLLRASTRRHKFILSPGLSEDSDVYNPVEDTSGDHRVSLSPMKVPKLDVSSDSKSEKKKSDFFTKLTAIRQAQSERRKAREEKELIRESITQDYPDSLENETVLKENVPLSASISREDSKEVEEIVQDNVSLTEIPVEISVKSEEEIPEVKSIPNIKEGTDDTIPVDFDTNWSESQGEWIEEYSDEQWEEGDEHWVGLGKKFQKMQKEFEEEARQMASLWEKEELEDDVFEEDTKVQQEAEVTADSDKKFNDWVKANLSKVDSSEYEEEETKGKPIVEDIPASISLKDRIEIEVSGSSPLQHYPTEHDLSLKSQFESDWVDLPADEEIEKLAHDIVCEGSDIENKFDEDEIVSYEGESRPMKLSDQGSDEDWEKIEMDEQLQEVNELDNFAFPEKEAEIDKSVEEVNLDVMEREITIEDHSKVLYKNFEIKSSAVVPDLKEEVTDSTEDKNLMSDIKTDQPILEEDVPLPPVRRKSRLSSASIQQALENQVTSQASSDIPPALPEKAKHKQLQQQQATDIYSLPDKSTKIIQPEEDFISKEAEVPQKPPRLNLSPVLPAESSLEQSRDYENEPKIPPRTLLSTTGSPLSLSYESDSNCFADSESDTEIKLRRQKNKLRKLPKYENEIDDTEMEMDIFPKQKSPSEENEDILESNLDMELDEDIDPSLIESLPRFKDADYDPELPILLGGRGGRISDLEDMDAPKAFRQDTTRPLQLFKVVKKETPTNTLSRTSPVTAEQLELEASIISRTHEGIPLSFPTEIAPISKDSNVQVPFEMSPKLPVTSVYENNSAETFYYNEATSPQQNLVTNQVLDNQKTFDAVQTIEKLSSQVEMEQELQQDVQVVAPAKEENDELGFTEMESLSALADYFFGRYNEITPTRPKKKTPIRAKPPASDKSANAMSTSEIAPALKTETQSEMEQSAAAVLQAQPHSELDISTSDIQISNQVVSKPPVAKDIFPPEKPKEPIQSEPLPFAEDYLFGCYNQVVVPTKTRNKPVLTPIPKLGESLRTRSLQREEKSSPSTPEPTPVASPEPPELPSEEPVDQVSEDEENAIMAETSSIYDENFYELPPELLSNQSFDESSIYESFQDAIEDVQGSSVITSSVVNVRPKSVHFEEPQAPPVVPPRRNKTQTKPSPGTNESYADEYLYRQYEQVTQSTQAAKKKLPECSKDFRMQQGFEPTEFPCDTPLKPGEQDDDVMSSEISAEILKKSTESLKFSSECEFGNSEQVLDSIQQDVNIENLVTSKNEMLFSEGTSVSDKISTETEQDSVPDTDFQSSKNADSFEELSIPDQSEEIIEDSLSKDLISKQESGIVSGDLSHSSTDTSMNKSSNISDIKPDELSIVSNTLEMDQFVIIEPTHDIIDDAYNLYDIQESLVCDLNYIDVKGNIEDECTDDSEKEWKRNEDRKNYLNATFLKSGPNKEFTEDQMESSLSEHKEFTEDHMEPSLREHERCNLEEHTEELSSSDKLKTEEFTDIQENSDRNLQNLDSENFKDTSFAKESEIAIIDDELMTTETLDFKPLTDISEALIAEVFESKDSLTEQETQMKQTSELDETAEKMALERETSLQIDEKVVKNIYEEEVELNDKEAVESITKEMAESSENVVAETLTEEITDSIKKDICESIDQEVTESDLTASDVKSHIELVTQKAIVEYNAEAEMLKAVITDESFEISEDQQIENLEELEASGDLSDDNVSTHSSVSTQIAVSMKTDTKEVEGDEFSLIFEQNENIGSDYDTFASTSLPSAGISDDYQAFEKISTPTSEHDSFEKIEQMIEAVTQELEDFEYEDGCKLDFNGVDSYELSSSPALRESQSEEFDSEINLEGSVSEADDYESNEISLKKFSFNEEEFEAEIISEERKDTIENKDAVKLTEDSLYSENMLPVTILPDVTDTDSNELNLVDSKSLMEEESLPIMSHFYDDLYQNVQYPSFTLLSAESLYAKYGTNESSESGSDSDVDNITNKISEDMPQEDKHSVKENIIDVKLDQSEKNVQKLDSPVETSVKKDFDEIELFSDVDTQRTFETEFMHVTETVCQTDSTYELYSENKIQEDQEISKRKDFERTEIPTLFPEETKIVTVLSKSEEFMQSVKDLEHSEVKSVESKFSTSKSCQTEDSFEEDIFFDSFDDTFTIPSFIQLPIENQIKPETSEVSIQCELISIEDILSSQKLVSSITQIGTIASETQAVSTSKDSTIKLRDSAKKEIPLEEKEDSSCESFEDSDSDIFIDSPSSHDELEVGTKKGYLYAEVDSDTGFSSGSEYGWTKKSSLKQKDLKKTSVVTESQSQQIATSVVTTKKVIFDSTQSHLKESTHEESFSAESENKAYISGESTASEQNRTECDLENFEFSPSAESPSSIPIEIIERAITPIAIPQTPSFEEDLVFVEIEDRTEDAEVQDEIQEAAISTTPTVEYFYGPLPETVTIESLPDSNDKFFETASELSESMSLTYNETESFSYSDSSVPFSEEITSLPDTDITELASSNVLREKSLDECSVLLKGEIEDSISEYYPLSDSSSSLLPKESDILDFTQSKVSDISIKESSDVIKESLSDFASISEDLPAAVKDSLQSDEIETSVKIQHKMEICSEIISVESSEKLSEDKCDENKESNQLLDSEHHDPASDLKFTEISSEEELVISEVRKPSDVPPVPSDIVRYLYYDDSITFDDDSYHTQSENIEMPLLPAEEIKPVNSNENVTVEEDQEVQLIVALDEKSATQEESCILPTESMSHAEVIPNVESLHITVREADLNEELCQKSSEILVEQIQEIQPSMLEPSASVDVIPFSVTEATILPDDIEVPISGEVLKTDISITKGDINTSEADLKFPTVEVIAAENVTDLPATAEQLQEPIIHLNEPVLEPITAENILPSDVQTLTEIIDSDIVEPTIFRQISSDVPPVPSDIVRYLYYGDDITFDETTQSSSHSGLDSYNASVQPQIDVPEIYEGSDIIPELEQEGEVPYLKSSEFVSELSADSSQELSSKPDSGEINDLTPPSECVDNWFDIEEDKSGPSTNGKKEKQDSDQHSSTKSSAFKDSEQPCIPEYILSPLQSDLPIGKTDIDEVTDISTHFTMTDDSDRFSDIESDTSLNFEEECIYPHGISHLIDEDDLKDEQMFESISDEEEISPRTPEVKEIPGGFQFVPVEPLKDELIEAVLPEDSPVKSDECITSTESSEQHSKEQFAECIISSELLEQQSNNKIVQEHLEALKEKTDECIISSEFLELSKEHFSECLTSNELPDKESDEIVLQEILKEDTKERVDECVTSIEFSEHSKEQFAECVTSIDKELEMTIIKESLQEEPKEKFEENSISAGISELSKEDFAECLTSNELFDKESEIKISQDSLKEEQREKIEEIVISTEFSEVTKEEFIECLTPSKLLDQQPVEETLLDGASDHSFKELSEKATTSEIQLSLEDENGNFPELMSKEQEYVCSSAEAEVPLTSDGQQKVTALEAAVSFTEKIDEMDISCYIVAEEESHSNECLFVATEAANSDISLEKNELSMEAERPETTFVDKVEDVDVSSKSADEDSAEMTDNWFDADGKHIEADESVYELPFEDSNQSHLEINIVHELQEKIVEASFTEQALLDSSELKVIETKKTDSTILKTQEENITIQSSEVCQDQELQNNELNVDVILTDQMDKIATDAEFEKAEVSVTDDSLYTCEISETKEISIYQDINSETIDIAVDKQHDTLTQINASEQNSKQSSLGFLSPDIKNISDVKMGTESEISTTLKEEVNIELMSAVLDFEPTSLLDGALYDTQEVKSEAISHEELCLDEKLVADIFSHSDFKEDSSQGIITVDAGMERCQIIDDADIFESSPLSIIKIKDVEIAKAEIKDEYESNLKLSRVTDYGIVPVLSDKIEESETLQIKEESVIADTEEKGIVKSAILDVMQKSNENINKDIQKLSEETEIVDFIGEITETSFKEKNLASKAESQIVKFTSQTPQDEMSTEAKDEYVDFKGQFDINEIQKCVVTELSSMSEDHISDVYLKEERTANLTEIVNFKGDITMDKGEASIPVETSIAKIDEKEDFIVIKKDKMFSGTDSSSLEKVDFKGEFIITDDTVSFKNIEALPVDESVKKAPTIKDEIAQVKTDTQLFETVDFKGQPISDSSTPEYMIDEEYVDFRGMETVKSKPQGDQLEKVDFKGRFTISEEIFEMKEEVATSTKETAHSTNKTKNYCERDGARQSLEIVDFKGKPFNTDLTELESQKESTADFMEKKLQDVQDYNITLKTEDTLESVDFKGEFAPGTYDVTSQIEDKKDFASIKDFKSGITNESVTDITKEEPEKMDIQIKSESDAIFETVDFKGDLQVCQSEVKTIQTNIDVDLKTEVCAEKPKIKNVVEMIDSKERIYSSYTVVEEQKKEPEMKPSDDISPVLYSAYDETSYDAEAAEIYGYDTYEEIPTYGPQEMYEHNIYEQEVTYESSQMYDYISDQSVAFESQEPVIYVQTLTSGAVCYDMAESSDLYTCAETLSAAEDTSGQFYSLSDDLEDTSNITASDDFTDVPSHLTESSDKWSDVEGDFSFEDAELDRDKTPTRTLREDIEGKVFEDIAFEENAIKITSTDKKNENLAVFDSKKDIRLISETDQTMVQEVFELSSAGPKSENISEISKEAAFCDSKESQITEETVIETKVVEESARKIIESSDDVKERIESLLVLESKIQSNEQTSNDSLKNDHVEQSVYIDGKMFTAGKTDLKALDNIELLETEKSGDISVVSSAEDYFDVSTHQLTTEGSDKWSDVESEIEHLGKEFKISSAKIIKDSHEIIDEIIVSDVTNLTLDEPIEDIKVDSSSDEQWREHFADIKSLKDQLTTADTFTSMDVETAISKTHEDTSTDISSQFEKTESEYWLEAETEQSVSEFGDEAVFSSEKEEDRQFEVSDMRIIEERVTAIPLSLLHSSETATTISTSSSSYTDFETSDQTSDTCADQGATTENSDKWSDIEAEALIDDVLYGNVDINETIEMPDFPPLIKQCDENKDVAEVPLLDSHLKTIQISSETMTETSATSIVEAKTEAEVQDKVDSKSELWKTSQSYSSFEGADSTSANLTDSGQSSMQKESSMLSTPSSLTTSGMSGEEFTNVTPFDVINEESDKYSDISGDTSSVEEFEEESSVSLKADSKLLDYESDAVHSEVKVTMSGKEVEDKSLKGNIEESSSFIDDKYSLTSSEQTKVPISESSTPVKNLKSQIEITECAKEETLLETIETKTVESIEAVHIDAEEKLEESLSSKITDESETRDNFTDVPTHNLMSETSEAYCELESDHSMEEIENQDIEIETDVQGIQDITNLDSQNVSGDYNIHEITNLDSQNVSGDYDIQEVTNLDAQNISGDYEVTYEAEEQLEIVEEYNLDDIPEDELENYEDEYSLSEHFEINEDELIYPLPYNDWIEQSFELKEYGIEAAFSESGSDIHGLGIAYETYEDEDIQRAIDFNLSTFEENEENVENIVTTDSFKTMSNDASPHLKLSEKEFDTWSTADAPSIEEELEEQDNVLNKIDELLAEDFGLDTYPDSPLTDELSLDVEGYLQRDIATPDETDQDFTQLDYSSSPKDTLLQQTDKGFKLTDSKTIHTDVDFPISLQTNEAFEMSKVDEASKEVTGKDSSISLPSNTESKVLKSKTVSSEEAGKDSSVLLKLDKDLKEKSEAVSNKLYSKDSSFTDKKEILEADSMSSKLSLTKDSSQSLETSFSIRKEEKNVQSAEKVLEEIKVSKTIESDAKTDKEFIKSEFETDLQTSKSESIPSKLSLKDSSVVLQIDKKLDITDSDSASSKVLSKDLSQTLETSLTISKEKDVKPTEDVSVENKVSKIITSISKTDKEIEKSETEEKDLETLKSESISSKLVLKDSSFALQTEKKFETADSDSVSSKISLPKDLPQTVQTNFTVSKEKDAKQTEEISDEVRISKTITCISKTDKEFKKSESETEKDLKTSNSESITSKISLKDSSIALQIDKKLEIADSDSVSSKVNLPKDLSQTVETSFTVSKEKDAKPTEEISAEVKISKTITSISKTDKEFKKFDSEAVSMEVCLKTDSRQEVKEDSDFSISKDNTKSHEIQEKIKISEMSPTQPKNDFKFESKIESNKVTLEEDSAQILKTESKSESIVEQIPEDTKVSQTITSVSKTDKELEILKAESTKISLKKDSEQTVKTDSETKAPEIISHTSKALSGDAKTLIKQPESLVMVGEETNLHKVEETVPSRKIVASDLSSNQLKKETELVQSIDLKSEQSSVVEGGTSVKLKSSKHVSEKEEEASFKLTTSKELLSISDDVSASVMLSSSKTSKEEVKDQKVESTTFSASESDSSLDIPSKKLAKSLEASDKVSIKTKTSSESSETELLQSSHQLSESSKLSVVSSESVEVQSNIPIKQVRNDQTQDESVSLMHTVKSKEQITIADSIVAEVKPDIPKKTRQRSISSKEGTPVKDESDKKPSLPPKTSKRRSVSDSPSSSLGESRSSSSSAESLGSFESAASERSRKTSLKSSEEASMHSLSPEVPARRSRSKISSSSRSSSRDSDSGSAPSRSSSLKIRRRSSNFIEPEPIDLSKKRASIDERMLKLQKDGKCASREKAFIAAKLIEMQFEEEDALLASRQCNTVYHAVKFLTQLCEMCNCRFPINLMASMVHCAHKACKECFRAHFTSLIYDRSVFTLLCPICHTLDITDQNVQEYFIHLDMTLKNILEEKVYDLFQRKLRDEVLNKDPNFHWCSQCSSGFIASPRLKKLYCPDCSAITCALCHQTWELEHEGVHCERFQQWKDMHTPEPPPAGLVKYLTDRGISCPSCGILYQQACAGCLMYKCSHCSFEFCGFCTRPSKRGRDCADKTCESRGLHIHHVHNCLFFLRDKDMTEIQILLEEESISYLTIPPKDQIVKSRCQVREQKNAHGILTEDRCGRDIEPYCAGLCRIHYYEYLAEILRKNNISLLSIMTIQDLQFMLRKSRAIVPEKVKGETSEEYYERLINVIMNTLT